MQNLFVQTNQSASSVARLKATLIAPKIVGDLAKNFDNLPLVKQIFLVVEHKASQEEVLDAYCLKALAQECARLARNADFQQRRPGLNFKECR